MSKRKGFLGLGLREFKREVIDLPDSEKESLVNLLTDLLAWEERYSVGSPMLKFYRGRIQFLIWSLRR